MPLGKSIKILWKRCTAIKLLLCSNSVECALPVMSSTKPTEKAVSTYKSFHYIIAERVVRRQPWPLSSFNGFRFSRPKYRNYLEILTKNRVYYGKVVCLTIFNHFNHLFLSREKTTWNYKQNWKLRRVKKNLKTSFSIIERYQIGFVLNKMFKMFPLKVRVTRIHKTS